MKTVGEIMDRIEEIGRMIDRIDMDCHGSICQGVDEADVREALIEYCALLRSMRVTNNV
jgi:hypothetical protein